MEVQVRIRGARPEDQHALGQLKLKAALAWGDHVAELRALPDASRIAIEHIPFAIVAELAGDIVGFATVLPCDDDRQAELADLFVDPIAWRRGIGAQLIAAAEGRASALGASTLHLVANERAHAFYEALGFQTLGMTKTDFGFAPAMHKKLGKT